MMNTRFSLQKLQKTSNTKKESRIILPKIEGKELMQNIIQKSATNQAPTHQKLLPNIYLPIFFI